MSEIQPFQCLGASSTTATVVDPKIRGKLTAIEFNRIVTVPSFLYSHGSRGEFEEIVTIAIEQLSEPPLQDTLTYLFRSIYSELPRLGQSSCISHLSLCVQLAHLAHFDPTRFDGFDSFVLTLITGEEYLVCLDLLTLLAELQETFSLSFPELILSKSCGRVFIDISNKRTSSATKLVKLLEVLSRKERLPMRILNKIVYFLCSFVAFESQGAWNVMRLLLVHEKSWGCTLEMLFQILSSTYDNLLACDFPSSQILPILRGAIFFSSMAMWGSLGIPSLKPFWSTSLGCLSLCMQQIFFVTKSPDLATEVTLSVQRLVRKHGRILASEWPKVFELLDLLLRGAELLDDLELNVSEHSQQSQHSHHSMHSFHSANSTSHMDFTDAGGAARSGRTLKGSGMQGGLQGGLQAAAEPWKWRLLTAFVNTMVEVNALVEEGTFLFSLDAFVQLLERSRNLLPANLKLAALRHRFRDMRVYDLQWVEQVCPTLHMVLDPVAGTEDARSQIFAMRVVQHILRNRLRDSSAVHILCENVLFPIFPDVFEIPTQAIRLGGVALWRDVYDSLCWEEQDCDDEDEGGYGDGKPKNLLSERMLRELVQMVLQCSYSDVQEAATAELLAVLTATNTNAHLAEYAVAFLDLSVMGSGSAGNTSSSMAVQGQPTTDAGSSGSKSTSTACFLELPERDSCLTIPERHTAIIIETFAMLLLPEHGRSSASCALALQCLSELYCNAYGFVCIRPFSAHYRGPSLTEPTTARSAVHLPLVPATAVYHVHSPGVTITRVRVSKLSSSPLLVVPRSDNSSEASLNFQAILDAILAFHGHLSPLLHRKLLFSSLTHGLRPPSYQFNTVPTRAGFDSQDRESKVKYGCEGDLVRFDVEIDQLALLAVQSLLQGDAFGGSVLVGDVGVDLSALLVTACDVFEMAASLAVLQSRDSSPMQKSVLSSNCSSNVSLGHTPDSVTAGGTSSLDVSRAIVEAKSSTYVHVPEQEHDREREGLSRDNDAAFLSPAYDAFEYRNLESPESLARLNTNSRFQFRDHSFDSLDSISECGRSDPGIRFGCAGSEGGRQGGEGSLGYGIGLCGECSGVVRAGIRHGIITMWDSHNGKQESTSESHMDGCREGQVRLRVEELEIASRIIRSLVGLHSQLNHIARTRVLMLLQTLVSDGGVEASTAVVCQWLPVLNLADIMFTSSTL